MAFPKPYDTGNYVPVKSETTATELTVTGRVPVEIVGRYLRNGPNPVSWSADHEDGWLVSAGMVHGIRLRDGNAEWYRSRWVRSPQVAAALGEERRPGSAIPTPYDDIELAPNINVVTHRGRTFALTEPALSRAFELSYELDTVGPTDLNATLPGGRFTVHPKIDPEQDELHSVTYDPFSGAYSKGIPTLHHSIIGRDGRVRQTTDIPVHGLTVPHDMGLTENHALIFDGPLIVDMELALDALTALAEGRPVAQFPARWDHGYQNRIGVLPLDPVRGGVRWFDVESGYILHTLNSFEIGSSIELVAIRTPRMFDREPSTLYEDDSMPVLHRWSLDLETGRVREETVDDRPQDWPGVDNRRVGRWNRFGYSAECRHSAPLEFGPRLIKYDFVKDSNEIHDFGPDAEAGEPMFVAGAGTGEEDGWVLSLVYHAETDTSDLVILNAGDFTGEPEAVVHLPTRVPHGFHGCWSADTTR